MTSTNRMTEAQLRSGAAPRRSKKETAPFSIGDAGGRTNSDVIRSKKSELAYENIEQAFPTVDPGRVPCGSRILVQIRSPMKKTRGGLILTEESRETEYWNTQIAKVLKVGELAYKNRDTLEPWPEGAWCREGDYVATPKYGGDRWEVPVPESSEKALFVVFRDEDVIARITGDPLSQVAYIGGS